MLNIGGNILCRTENIVGMLKFTSHPTDLNSGNIYLPKIETFLNQGSEKIMDKNEGYLLLPDGERINYHDLVNIYKESGRYCQSYVSCLTVLYKSDFNLDGTLKDCVIRRLSQYSENRDFVLFSKKLPVIFQLMHSCTIELENKYFKKPSFTKGDKVQSFHTFNIWNFKNRIPSKLMSTICNEISNEGFVIYNQCSQEMADFLSQNNLLEKLNKVDIGYYENFIYYSDDFGTKIENSDKIRELLNEGNDTSRGNLEKLLHSCFQIKETKYSLEHEYRLLITEFSNVNNKFPDAIKLLYPSADISVDHKIINFTPFPSKRVPYNKIGQIKLNDFPQDPEKIVSYRTHQYEDPEFKKWWEENIDGKH